MDCNLCLRYPKAIGGRSDKHGKHKGNELATMNDSWDTSSMDYKRSIVQGRHRSYSTSSRDTLAKWVNPRNLHVPSCTQKGAFSHQFPEKSLCLPVHRKVSVLTCSRKVSVVTCFQKGICTHLHPGRCLSALISKQISELIYSQGVSVLIYSQAGVYSHLIEKSGACAHLFEDSCLCSPIQISRHLCSPIPRQVLCSPIPRQVSVLTYFKKGVRVQLFKDRCLPSPIPRQGSVSPTYSQTGKHKFQHPSCQHVSLFCLQPFVCVWCAAVVVQPFQKGCYTSSKHYKLVTFSATARRLHRLAEFIPWDRFLSSINF